MHQFAYQTFWCMSCNRFFLFLIPQLIFLILVFFHYNFSVISENYFNYVLLTFVRLKIISFAGVSNPGPSVSQSRALPIEPEWALLNHNKISTYI